MNQKIIKRKRLSKESKRRRNEADECFESLSQVVADYGIDLQRVSYGSFTASNGEWLISIFPGKQRLAADESRKAQPPLLKLKKPWGLVNAVDAIIEKVNVSGDSK